MIGGLADDLGHALHYDTVAPPSAAAQQLYDRPVPGEVERNPLDQLGRSFLDIDTGVAKSLANTVAKGYGAVVGKDYVPFPKPFEGADPQSVRFLSHASDLGRAAAATPAVKLPAMAYDYLRNGLAAGARMLGGPEAGAFTYGLTSAMPDAFAEGGEVGEIGSAIGDAVSGAVKDAVGAPEAAAGRSAALPLMQLAPEHAQSFSDALSAAKAANPWGDQVYQYPTEDYSAMKMFMTPDQKSGYAIKPDGDIVSVFQHPESPEMGFGVRALNHAVQNGGTKLDTVVHPQAGLARYTAEADPSVLQYSQRTGKTELPIVYHGTASPENFKGFDIRDNAYYDPHQSGYNGFVAEDHNFASDYANNGGGGGIPNLEALAAAGHEGLPAGPRVLPMRFGPRKLYDPRTPEGQQVAADWFSSPEGRELYDTSPRLRDRLLGDYYHGPGSMLSPEQRQAYVDQNLFAHHVANSHANWVPMEVPEFVDHLRSKGYDAAALREAGAWNYGLLDPGAVKSSVGNVGTYDRSNPDLLKADGGAVTPPVSAFRAAYPGANPAYGTKPVVVNGKTLQASADPDIIARAREAMQRLQDQMSADSARRASGQGVPASQYGQKPQFADGGLKGEAGEVLGGIGDAVDQSVIDALSAGRPAPQLADRYPATLPGQMMTDPKSGRQYMGKVNSPEADALTAFRKSAQSDIAAGNYDPYFPPAQRADVDPSLFPATFDSLSIMPKKEATIAKYAAHAASPDATQRLSQAYEAQLPGSDRWYYMKQLMDAYTNELGPEAGQAAFKKNFADAMAATTGGADPTANFLMAHYGNYRRNLGLSAPEAAHEMPYPIGGRYASGNMGMYNQFINGGEPLGAGTPKRGNFSLNFLGHKNRATIDEQVSSGFDPAMSAPPKGTYGVYEQALGDLASKYGVAPRDFQDVAWAGLKQQSTPNLRPIPMIDHVNQSIERTSRVTGLPQSEVVQRFVNGTIPMYAAGGPARG